MKISEFLHRKKKNLVTSQLLEKKAVLKTDNIVQVAKELLKQQQHKDALEKLKDA